MRIEACTCSWDDILVPHTVAVGIRGPTFSADCPRIQTSVGPSTDCASVHLGKLLSLICIIAMTMKEQAEYRLICHILESTCKNTILSATQLAMKYPDLTHIRDISKVLWTC